MDFSQQHGVLSCLHQPALSDWYWFLTVLVAGSTGLMWRQGRRPWSLLGWMGLVWSALSPLVSTCPRTCWWKRSTGISTSLILSLWNRIQKYHYQNKWHKIKAHLKSIHHYNWSFSIFWNKIHVKYLITLLPLNTF